MISLSKPVVISLPGVIGAQQKLLGFIILIEIFSSHLFSSKYIPPIRMFFSTDTPFMFVTGENFNSHSSAACQGITIISIFLLLVVFESVCLLARE